VLALKVLLMVLYWGAQWLIAASVVRGKPVDPAQSKD
jgi:hypothetical protein